jgi:protein-S-isoprenylcysteine O-methyltransferase Ste14
MIHIFINMLKIIAFVILTIPVVYISRKALFIINSHGFYRFLSWECILWLAVNNIIYWFQDPFSWHQIVSWLLLLYSLFPLIIGILTMKKFGKAQETREDKSLYKFEKTTELIEKGIFKYIRHPLYSSLVFLTWGIFFKNMTYLLFIISLASTFFLFMTARMDEKENIVYFGEKYKDYMKRTKMFVPYIL